MPIQRLPGDVAVQIKSSTTVTSLNGAVLELLKNALDADARNVTIAADYTRGGCTVEDDGAGIPPYEFSPEGGLCKRYYTSKYPSSPGFYGRHGLFLASASALSLLTVTSRCQGHDTWGSLAIHNGKLLRRTAASPPEDCAWTATPHGTRVSVRDLFGCMPVRARLRPLRASAEWTREWDSLVHSVTALLLSYPKDVAVTFKHDGDGSGSCKRTLHKRCASGRASTVSTVQLLAQAGYSDVADLSSWVDVEASMSGISIAGCMSLVPVASKKAQFIGVGIEPLPEDSTIRSLYDQINKLFAESNFGAARKTTAGPFGRATREMKPRKAVDRWPMFNICIDLEDSVAVDDVLSDQRQHLSIIKRLLQVLVSEFLAKHGLCAEAEVLEKGQSRLESTLPTKKHKTLDTRRLLPVRGKDSSSTSLFSLWPQTKRSSRPQKKGADNNAMAPVCHEKDEKSKFFADPCSRADGSEGPLCMDSSTGMDSWDQNVLANGDLKISRSSLASARVIGQVDQKFILLAAPVSRGSTPDNEESVLVLVDQHAADERVCVEALLSEYFTCATSPPTTSANTIALAKPLWFELPSHELSALHRGRGYFHHWGIHYDVLASDESPLLRVDRLPVCIADRCAQEPRLVMNILRSELPTLSDKANSLPSAEETMSWTARMHGCPRGILDLINLKACRSAIKFNDPLTRDECIDLVARLLDCSFPFQCAHGRPSMVPVINLG